MTLSRQNFSNLANAGIAGASKKDLKKKIKLFLYFLKLKKKRKNSDILLVTKNIIIYFACSFFILYFVQ